MKFIFRVICFDNNTDVKNSVSDIMETTSLGTALIRLLDYNFHKEDSCGDPIVKAGLVVYRRLENWDQVSLYSTKSVRDFERLCG